LAAHGGSYSSAIDTLAPRSAALQPCVSTGIRQNPKPTVIDRHAARPGHAQPRK
jgi:hypothetical protein